MTTDTYDDSSARELRAKDVAKHCGDFRDPVMGAETAYHAGYVDGLRKARNIYGPLIGLTYYEIDYICARCGKQWHGETKDPSKAGYVSTVCTSCTEG